ncbi:MAG TPA: iron-containing alcohol dehydrogenase [Ktedonobacteraceae bacterium]|nr:iron-containing alcohol dehydrogenase [Ktedonobacteraceae bacterium]
MFEQVPVDLLRRAMQPSLVYGHNILAKTAQQIPQNSADGRYVIMTQPEPWISVRQQFTDLKRARVIYLHSMEQDELAQMERMLPSMGMVMGIGGGQAMDAAKYVAWKRGIPLVLAPTIISVDAAVTNTIAVRTGNRVRYIGFVVADAIAVDFAVISRAPADLNRAGIGDLLSIHTALWDWQHGGNDYDTQVATQIRAILDELEARAEAISRCDEEALRSIMENFVRENTFCLQTGSSRPEEGSEHFLAYNIEYITRRGYVHGQLISLCTHVMARLQENRAQWVRQLIERVRCPWRLHELGISREAFIHALLTLRPYAEAEAFPTSVINLRQITPLFARQVASECE